MIVDPASSLQAVFVALLMQRGRVVAENWFTRQMVERGPLHIQTEQHLYGSLWAAGVGAEVLGVVDSASDRVYARAIREGAVAFGIYKYGTGPDDSIWGLMYRKPCRCAGLALLDPERNRPVPAVPHRQVYLDCAVRLLLPVRVRWPDLVGLPVRS